ncbi:MAG TPA: Na+/H+ antiporter NhaA [Croceibacterium sp.]
MPKVSIPNSSSHLLKSLLASQAFAGVLLIAVAALAIAIANSPLAEAYHRLFHAPLPWTPIAHLYTAHLWINDALMAVFFFVVGLEVKREMVTGNLADPKVRRLPVLAAIAGMIAPALVYLAIAGGDPELTRGWAIPAATDIAFAVGVIALLGKRVPPPLRLFLLTVAIVDDIGAVLVIALFYTPGIDPAWALAATLVTAGLIALNRMGIGKAWPYALGAMVLWYCVLHSGIHATIAGVVAALTVPTEADDGNDPLERFEHGLTNWNIYLVVPLFGFANAGVTLGDLPEGAAFAALPLAIGAGLVVGKQVGIFSSIVVADRIGFAPRPPGASWGQIWGASVLCGIGFTMSLFIGALAFPHNPLLVEEAKLGVLGGSLISAVLGFLVLRFARPLPAKTQAPSLPDHDPLP